MIAARRVSEMMIERNPDDDFDTASRPAPVLATGANILAGGRVGSGKFSACRGKSTEDRTQKTPARMNRHGKAAPTLCLLSSVR
jgi:hypothetical protein